MGQKNWQEVFLAFLKLGLTSFGGPVAHLGYFRHEIVERRGWVDDKTYADLVALCQFLPGPASSQVGIALGLSRAGYAGAFAAWLGFTLPSALALTLFGLGLTAYANIIGLNWLYGFKIAAVAVVAQAVLAMGRKLTPDFLRVAFALGTAAVALLIPSIFGQIGIIALGGIFGFIFLKSHDSPPPIELRHGVSQTIGITALVLFFGLLLLLPLLATVIASQGMDIFSGFYRAGSLVFGGGHVVLPLLQAEVVASEWVTEDAFLAGYGAAQAVPGPLFTFAAYLGAVMEQEPRGWAGAGLCLTAIFLPSFLLVIGVLPFWEKMRKYMPVQACMRGVNAAVVGLLLAALYHPLATMPLSGTTLALTGFFLLEILKSPPWLVVALSVTAGFFITPA